MADQASGGADRVLTLPNLVTVVRLLCVPVFVALLAGPHRVHWLAAGIVLAALGTTDWVDGQLARRLHQVSTVGKVIDPLADRVLLLAAAVSVVWFGAVPAWVAAVVLAREAVVVLGALVVAAAGGRRVDVTLVGKAGTLMMMFAFPLFVFGHALVGWHQIPEDAAWAFAIPGMVLAWVAAAGYVPAARTAVSDGRRQRVGSDVSDHSVMGGAR
ncbi:MAG TPA: CDP-alcohol phosphatidyltransferase family protein [Acidimicrobiales bacterium]|nr:CDP-alcohol phosphatidyltransferase family protein [Acidimicrobiales bacterium]